MKSNDTQYKDGYQVEEGGDYIVRAFDPLKTKKSDKHLVLRASNGRVLGTYLSRASACKRAQQFGGNTPRSRTASLHSHVRKNLTPAEDAHVAKAKALRAPVVAAPVEPLKLPALTNDEGVISESQLTQHGCGQDTWTRTLILKYLRPYSLGPGPSGDFSCYAKNRYTRKSVATAWLTVPPAIRREREAILQGYYIDDTVDEYIARKASMETSAVTALSSVVPDNQPIVGDADLDALYKSVAEGITTLCVQADSGSQHANVLMYALSGYLGERGIIGKLAAIWEDYQQEVAEEAAGRAVWEDAPNEEPVYEEDEDC